VSICYDPRERITNDLDPRVALITLGVIGIVMALGVTQWETRLRRRRPEYRRRA
jgi:hypothetical protein